MPTKRLGHVRGLLKTNRAVIVSYRPFTIQLKYGTPKYVQEVSLGVDTGSKHVGLSVTTPRRVLFEAQLELRDDVSRKLRERKTLRKNRRAKHTRYRKQRSLNRISSKPSGWIAPSVRHKVAAHCYWINHLCHIMPICRIIIEVGNFDIQALMARDMNKDIPHGSDYAHGDQYGFNNVRAYVLHRDNYICAVCRGSRKEHKLHVHHIRSRQVAGDSPHNLITLCAKCHELYHKGLISLPSNVHSGISYKDAAMVSIMKPYILSETRKLCGDAISCKATYGYITSAIRMQHGLPKAHHVDARCISGNPNAVPDDNIVYLIHKIRVNNRQLHMATYNKFGVRRKAQAPKEVFGYRLMDLVRYANRCCVITGRRSNGAFALSELSGQKLKQSVSYKKLTLVHHTQSYLITVLSNG